MIFPETVVCLLHPTQRCRDLLEGKRQADDATELPAAPGADEPQP